MQTPQPIPPTSELRELIKQLPGAYSESDRLRICLLMLHQITKIELQVIALIGSNKFNRTPIK